MSDNSCTCIVVPVGSFVWTHLENLKETSMPSRAHLQGLISNEAIASKFTADVRKFSRNIEISGFYDQLNVGMKIFKLCVRCCSCRSYVQIYFLSFILELFTDFNSVIFTYFMHLPVNIICWLY